MHPSLLLSLILGLSASGESSSSGGLPFGDHYFQALKGEAAGIGIGLVVGLGATYTTGAPNALGAGLVGGSVIGTTYGATNATPLDEQNGSVPMSAMGSLAGGYMGGLAGWEWGIFTHRPSQKIDFTPFLLGAVGWTLVSPLGAVALERWSRAEAFPSVALWTPHLGLKSPIGLKASWRLP